MKRAISAVAGIACFASALLLAGSGRSEARDLGQLGQSFPVIEPDLLSTIEARLRRAEASGEMARANAAFARRVEAKARRPDPVTGITPADTPRSWDFDPSIVLEHEVRDQKGQLIAAAGQRINPLDFVGLRQQLVFVDGDDADQVDWATRRYTDLQAKIIFVAGSPIDAMTARKRRFYFDQEGRLTARFGIRHTPAVVSQAGRGLHITETVVGQGKRG